jgi:acyl-coenzyme A synthetase/AMP-(fatty) acid ligase
MTTSVAMHYTPLIGSYSSEDVLAWEQGRPRTAKQFLADVSSMAVVLPDRPTVLNLVHRRYGFLVGLAAAILRHQVTLLPQNRTPEGMRRLLDDYPGSYCLTDQNEIIEGVESIPIPARQPVASFSMEIPHISTDQIVAIAFTSGSTGRPKPHAKTWGALTAVAYAIGAGLGVSDGRSFTVVATVPHHHMFGLEASVMLPIMHGATMHGGRPLFPADVVNALTERAGAWILVTTPLHLRACMMEGVKLPPGGLILSATAPLARTVAQEAERHFQAEVHEIFGFAEAGSVAQRRTIDGDHWNTLDGVRLTQHQGSFVVQASYLPAPVQVPDRISVNTQGGFVLHGREADHVNVAGHRVSLGDLTKKLLAIDGVQDGVFVLPDEGSHLVTRLVAFVVAPGRTSEEIQSTLRMHVDPVFLPRPLICVPSLPRNGTGKLPRESVLALARQWMEGKGDGV